MLFLNRTLILVKPKKPFIDWVNSTADEPIAVEEIMEDPSCYLIEELDDDSQLQKYVKKRHVKIFEDQLEGWYTDSDSWPEITYKIFKEWFDIESSTMIADLVDEPIELEDM